MTEREDADIVEAVLAGRSQFFEKLVVKYEKPLFNAAYRITCSQPDAMDALQSAFLKAYEKLHTFDPAFRFFSWMYRIVVNESLNLVKRRRDTTELVDERRPDDRSGPESSYLADERSRQVQAAIAELTPEHRVVIVLRHFQGLSYQEMAEVIDIPETTVKSRLYEARRTLRTIFEAKGVTT